jgi:uncharacterized sodium:solute symporter family permease YidK
LRQSLAGSADCFLNLEMRPQRLAAGAIAFGLLAFLFETLRLPILRLAVALIFAIPAAIAGYALVHGITREAVPSETWRQNFCAIGGLVVGVSALTRLAAPATARAVRLLASIAIAVICFPIKTGDHLERPRPFRYSIRCGQDLISAGLIDLLVAEGNT